ncbi:hypothetical protein [Azospirillum largimobile]
MIFSPCGRQPITERAPAPRRRSAPTFDPAQKNGPATEEGKGGRPTARPEIPGHIRSSVVLSAGL